MRRTDVPKATAVHLSGSGSATAFADSTERHQDVIAAYCMPRNKVSLGFVEGFNNKIRVFQRCAYGPRDQEDLLKVLTSMFPAL